MDSELKENDRRIAACVTRTTIGGRLQVMYRRLVQEPVPPRIADLLRRLDGGPGR